METWRRLSESSMSAAEVLLRSGQFRSSVSRSYYAAYCTATGEIVRSLTTFPNGRRNPPHETVTQYVQNNLAISQLRKRTIQKLIRVLRQLREDADYRPYRQVSKETARDCIRDARRAQQELWERER